MLAAVCCVCVVSGGSAAMQWTVGGGVYAVCEQNCAMYCGTAGRQQPVVGLIQQLLKVRQIRRAVAAFSYMLLNCLYLSRSFSGGLCVWSVDNGYSGRERRAGVSVSVDWRRHKQQSCSVHCNACGNSTRRAGQSNTGCVIYLRVMMLNVGLT